MAEFFANYWPEIILTLITSGTLGICKYFHGQLKNYKKLLGEKSTEELNEAIDNKIEPIQQEIEELRSYMRKTRETE